MSADANIEPANLGLADATAGTLAVVVGPSGAGKDTLMNLAAQHFAGRPDVHFVRRVITRDGDAGNEDHRSVSEADFDAMEQAGAFAVSWEAHGLKYGIPKQIDDAIAAGQTAVCNVSRTVIASARERYDDVVSVLVTAPPDILARRLAGRSRASDGNLTDRLARHTGIVPALDIVINNIHTEADSVRELIRAIKIDSPQY